jgi:hypothetical protein
MASCELALFDSSIANSKKRSISEHRHHRPEITPEASKNNDDEMMHKKARHTAIISSKHSDNGHGANDNAEASTFANKDLQRGSLPLGMTISCCASSSSSSVSSVGCTGVDEPPSIITIVTATIQHHPQQQNRKNFADEFVYRDDPPKSYPASPRLLVAVPEYTEEALQQAMARGKEAGELEPRESPHRKDEDDIFDRRYVDFDDADWDYDWDSGEESCVMVCVKCQKSKDPTKFSRAAQKRRTWARCRVCEMRKVQDDLSRKFKKSLQELWSKIPQMSASDDAEDAPLGTSDNDNDDDDDDLLVGTSNDDDEEDDLESDDETRSHGSSIFW